MTENGLRFCVLSAQRIQLVASANDLIHTAQTHRKHTENAVKLHEE